MVHLDVKKVGRILDDDGWRVQGAHADGVWNVRYDYHRPRTTAVGKPPAARLRTGVTTVMNRTG